MGAGKGPLTGPFSMAVSPAGGAISCSCSRPIKGPAGQMHRGPPRCKGHRNVSVSAPRNGTSDGEADGLPSGRDGQRTEPSDDVDPYRDWRRREVVGGAVRTVSNAADRWKSDPSALPFPLSPAL